VLDKQKTKLAQLGERQARIAKAQAVAGKWRGRAGTAAAVGIGAGGGAAAIAMPLKDELDQSNEFESRMTDIAQKADLGRVAAEAMGRQLRQTALDVNQLPENLQDAADALAGFGLDPKLAVALTNPIGKAGTAYKADLADLSAASYAAIDNLKVPTGQVGRVLDVMAFAGKKGAFEIKDMAGAFPELTASYQALGQSGVSSVADLAAALQITRKGAGDSATAANNLANVLQKISSPQTGKAFAKMGINLEQEMKRAAAAGKTPIEAIAEATNKALKGDMSKLGSLFEDAQVQQGLRPIIANLKEYRDIRSQAMGAKGVVDADFAQRMLDNAEKTKAMSAAVKDLQLEFATGLAPTVTPIIQKITAVTRNFSAWTKEHPKLAGAMGKTVLVVGVLLAVIAAVALIVAPILLFIGALGAAAAALGVTIGSVFATIVGVVAAVIAIFFLVVGAVKGWHKIAPIVSAVVASLGQRLGQFMVWLFNLHLQFFQAGQHIIAGLAKGITSALGGVKKAIFGAGDAVVGWFKEKLGIHSPSRVFAGLGGFLMSGLGNGIDAGAQGPLRRVASVAGQLTSAFAVAAAVPAMAAPALATSSLAASQVEARSMVRPISTGPGAGAGGGGMPQMVFSGDINIQLTAPAGADQAQLAKMLKAAFQQLMGDHQAKATAATRSAFYDDED